MRNIWKRHNLFSLSDPDKGRILHNRKYPARSAERNLRRYGQPRIHIPEGVEFHMIIFIAIYSLKFDPFRVAHFFHSHSVGFPALCAVNLRLCEFRRLSASFFFARFSFAFFLSYNPSISQPYSLSVLQSLQPSINNS